MGKNRTHKKFVKAPSRIEKPIINERDRKERIIPVVAALKAVDIKERWRALEEITKMVEDASARHMLLRERLIHVIMSTTLSDSAIEVVAKGFETLRKIVSAVGRDPALFLVRGHINTPINAMSEKAEAAFDNYSLMDTSQTHALALLSENICGLVSAIIINLGEMKDVSHVTHLATRIVKDESTGISREAVDAAFETLYYQSEVDEDLLSTIMESSNFKFLSAAAHSWPSKTFTLGIELNAAMLGISNDDDPDAAAQDVAERLSALTKVIPDAEVKSVEVCLELLALVSQTDIVAIMMELLENVVPKVIRWLSYNHFLVRCINVLNNIGWSLNRLEIPWTDDATEIFDRTADAILSQAADTEVLGTGLGLLSATVTQNSNLINSPMFAHIVELVSETIKKCLSAQEENQRTNEWVPLATGLVNLLAGRAAVTLHLVNRTTELIFIILQKSDDPEAQIDALNAMFTLHGDNDADYNEQEYVNQNLNTALTELKPRLKRSLKSVPKNVPELRSSASDALINLDNFILYKNV